MESLLGKCGRSELWIVGSRSIRIVEQTETVLQTEDSAHGIVDTRHWHLAFLNQFLKQHAEVHAVWIHAHIDTCIDGNADSVFLVLCHLLALEKVVDICPVGHNHAIPVEVFLEPLGEVFGTGMNRHSID